MLRSALSFAPIVERLVRRPVPWAQLVSTPFVYLIARDSQLTQTALVAHYSRLNQELAILRDDGFTRYLQAEAVTLWRAIDTPPAVSDEVVSAAVATPEVAVSTAKLRTLFAEAVRDTPAIETHFGHRIEQIRRSAEGFVIEGRATEAAWKLSSDLVVNCLWSDRLRIDAQLGAPPQRKWVYRLKYRVLADLPDPLIGRLPSLTMVLGKYGDIVTREGEQSAYLSWYPACLRGWATDLVVPQDWRGPIDGKVDPEMAADVARETLTAFDAVVPGTRHARVTDVRAGVIVSWGATDIDDPVSELHERRHIGVQGRDGYFSIDTGKLTCAPLFAMRLLDLLE
jgi:hypothetical protein